MKTLIAVLLISVFIIVNAQYPNGIHPEHKRANIWYFGSDSLVPETIKLDFNNGQPDVSIVPVYQTTGYGFSTISDTAGNMMFFSYGTVLFDKNNQYMTTLTGSEWAVNGTLFLPVPGNDSLLLLFHSYEIYYSGKGSIFYTVINYKANNGLGVVLENSIPLLPEGAGSVTAAYHSNGHDFWVVATDTTSNIYSWLIDSTIYPQAVDTMQITSVRTLFGAPILRFIPVFTTKPSADLLGIVSHDYENLLVTDYTLSILHFDNTLGEFKNELLLESHAGELIAGDYFAFQLYFSPRGNWLYVTFEETCMPRNGYIKRYTNLYNATNPGDIYSEIIYNTTTHAAPYTVHATPLGTMICYLLPGDVNPNSGNTPYLSTILYPDSTNPVFLYNNINTGALTTWSAINNLPVQWYYRSSGYYTGKEKITDEKLIVAPNPADNIIFILNGYTNVKDIEIYNINGVKCNIKSQNNYSVNISKLPDGIYLMKVNFKNGYSKTTKIMVKH